MPFKAYASHTDSTLPPTTTTHSSSSLGEYDEKKVVLFKRIIALNLYSWFSISTYIIQTDVQLMCKSKHESKFDLLCKVLFCDMFVINDKGKALALKGKTN